MSGSSLPDPAVVVLIGVSGSGKSHWAAQHYRASEVVSSDALRAVVGSGPHDLEASADAFALLDTIVAARVQRGLTAVVDTLGLDPERRRRYLGIARSRGLPAVAVVVETPEPLCRARNSARDVPVPATVLTGQLRRMRSVGTEVATEGWDVVVAVNGADQHDAPSARPLSAASGRDRPAVPGGRRTTRPDVVLQLSRFPWGEDRAGWLRAVVGAAEDAGLAGIAVMDHLIQIPQVGRAWEDLPEAYVTLATVAAYSTTLEVGALCTPATFRAPGVLAKQVATLDALSGGRAFLGLGAGWWEREHAAFGLGFPSVAERFVLLERTLQTVRGLWAAGTRPYSGSLVHLPETTCYPRPVSDIPVLVGGAGERRTLRLAAQYADACNVRSDEDLVLRSAEVLRRHCLDLGRDPAEVAMTVLDLPVLGRDREHVAGVVEKHRGRTSAAWFAARFPVGTPADHAARYRRLADLGVSTVYVAPIGGLGGPADLAVLADLVAALAE